MEGTGARLTQSHCGETPPAREPCTRVEQVTDAMSLCCRYRWLPPHPHPQRSPREPSFQAAPQPRHSDQGPESRNNSKAQSRGQTPPPSSPSFSPRSHPLSGC